MSIHVVDVCIRVPPVVSKTNRIPRFGARCGFGGFDAMTWAGRLDRHASPFFLSSSPAKNRASGNWPSRKKRRVGAARRRSRGHGPARLDGTRPRATVADKVMKSGETAGHGNGPSTRRPHGKRSAQARIWKPGRRRQPSGARERWKPARGETRAARLDAQHDSATGRASWPGTPRPELAFGYLSTCSMADSGVPTELAWSNTLPGIVTIKDRP